VVAHAAHAVCGDRLVASAVAQEAFAIALASWPRVEATDRPRLWLRRVGINLAMRSRKSDDPGADAPGGSRLARAIQALPTPQRLALVLHHVHRLTVGEVAETMGLREESVGVHLGRAHRAVLPGADEADVGPAIAAALWQELRAVTELLPERFETEPWSRPTLVFVVSPALGPGTLSPTVDAVAGLGHAVNLVDLSDLAELSRPRWRAAAGRIAAAVYATSGPVVLVGHGQAGPLLVPASDLRRVCGVILVDAPLPPLSGEVSALEAGLVAALDDRVVDGRLPPWETWWPQCALEFLVDDDALRRRLRDELPAVPATYGSEQIPVGARWRSVPGGYLRLSLARESEATFAGMRGMAVERLSADHLATATQPDAVAARLAALVAALEPAMI